MNTNCLADCKHKEICKLTAEDTERCKLKEDEWVKNDGKIFGMTTKEICCKQGRTGDLKTEGSKEARTFYFDNYADLSLDEGINIKELK